MKPRIRVYQSHLFNYLAYYVYDGKVYRIDEVTFEWFKVWEDLLNEQVPFVGY